jgi:hypothetical protein
MKGIIGVPHTGVVQMEFVKSLMSLNRPDGAEIFGPENTLSVGGGFLPLRRAI